MEIKVKQVVLEVMINTITSCHHYHLISLQCSPEPNDPQDAVVATMFKDRPAEFLSTAKYWTESYAKPADGGVATVRGVMMVMMIVMMMMMRMMCPMMMMVMMMLMMCPMMMMHFFLTSTLSINPYIHSFTLSFIH
jgi:hypothetical protein